MTIRFAHLALAATLATGTLLPTFAQARAPLAPCELLKSGVTQVKPHSVTEHHGKIVLSRIDGASVFVPAQPGLTAEWLQRSLTDHMTKMRSAPSMADCPLEARDLKISVQSGGSGYWVTIQARDNGQADLVLKRANELLQHRHS